MRNEAGLTNKPLEKVNAYAHMDLCARVTTLPKPTMTVTALEAAVPGLAAARSLVDRFGIMIHFRTATELDSWIEQARTSMVAPLARGVAKDKAAIRAAITEPWANGQTEGQSNRLKLIKRQMYGRAKFDLLEARLIGAV